MSTAELKEKPSPEKKKKTLDTYERKFAKVQEAKQLTDCSYWRKGFETRKKHVDTAYKDLKQNLNAKVEDIEAKDDLKGFKTAFSNLEKQVEELHNYTRDIVTDVNELSRYVNEMPIFKEHMKLTAEWDAVNGNIEIKDNK